MQALKNPEIFDLHNRSNSVWLEDMDESSLWTENQSGSLSTVFHPQEAVPSLSLRARKMILKIKSFPGLPKNWDGYGAEPPKNHVVQRAISFLWSAANDGIEPYFAGPGPNGEIMLEFKSNPIEAEIYFEENCESEVLLYRDGECILEGPVENMYDLFIEHLREHG